MSSSGISRAQYLALSKATHFNLKPHQNPNFDGTVPEGFTHVKTYDDPKTGLKANLFQRNNSSEYVLAFKGTDPEEGLNGGVQDLIDDVRIFQGKAPRQVQSAQAVTQDAYETIGPNASLSYTGQSLGGFLAQTMAATDNREKETVTFNAPGAAEITRKTLGNGPMETGNIDNYIVSDDPIGNFGAHLGDVHVLSANGKDLLSAHEDWTRLANDTVIATGDDPARYDAAVKDKVAKLPDVLGLLFQRAFDRDIKPSLGLA